MKRLWLVFLLSFCLSIPAIMATQSATRVAMAQAEEACPAGFSCVTYPSNDPKAVVIAVDPKQGPVQAVVVREVTTTVTDFNGTTSTATVTLVVLLEQEPGRYAIAQVYNEPREGDFAKAGLEDVFTLTEAQ